MFIIEMVLQSASDFYRFPCSRYWRSSGSYKQMSRGRRVLIIREQRGPAYGWAIDKQ